MRAFERGGGTKDPNIVLARGGKLQADLHAHPRAKAVRHRDHRAFADHVERELQIPTEIGLDELAIDSATTPWRGIGPKLRQRSIGINPARTQYHSQIQWI